MNSDHCPCTFVAAAQALRTEKGKLQEQINMLQTKEQKAELKAMTCMNQLRQYKATMDENQVRCLSVNFLARDLTKTFFVKDTCV
jgi:hypothetical protein